MRISVWRSHGGSRFFILNFRRVASWSGVKRVHGLAPAALLADAASQPARLAVVLVAGNEIPWTDAAPPRELTRCFAKRADSQIMALDLAAPSLGLSMFADRLAGRQVVAFSDKIGAECALRSANARSFDHARIVHTAWLQLAEAEAQCRLMRVPTALNLADLPSRSRYKLLRSMGAVYSEPRWKEAFLRLESAGSFLPSA